jgi:hypothetical protein
MVKYFKAINSPQEGQTALPRPGDIVLWPSYFCLVVAVVSVVLSAIIMTAYFQSTEAAKVWEDRRGRFSKAAALVKFGLSTAVAASMYSTSSADIASLWGITCHSQPANIFQQAVNFNQLCSIQVWSAV